jgi:hypothetical protein
MPWRALFSLTALQCQVGDKRKYNVVLLTLKTQLDPETATSTGKLMYDGCPPNTPDRRGCPLRETCGTRLPTKYTGPFLRREIDGPAQDRCGCPRRDGDAAGAALCYSEVDRRAFGLALCSGDASRVSSATTDAAAIAESKNKGSAWQAYLQGGLDILNKQHAVSNAQKIQKFEVVPGDFSEKGGELTATLKLKRSVAAEKYAAVIEALY